MVLSLCAYWVVLKILLMLQSSDNLVPSVFFLQHCSGGSTTINLVPDLRGIEELCLGWDSPVCPVVGCVFLCIFDLNRGMAVDISMS